MHLRPRAVYPPWPTAAEGSVNGVEGRKVKKEELVEQLARRLARLSKDDLQSIADAAESGAVDFEALARDARRAAAADNGPAFGFQLRLQSAWRRGRRRGS